MTPTTRRLVCFGSAAAVGGLLLHGLVRLPSFGSYRGPYGDVLNATAVGERHATNIPSAVNFDYRAFDTVGEEFILFVAVVGLAVLFREQRDQSCEQQQERRRHISEAVQWVGIGLFGFLVLLGATIVLHGHLTPGGGFQGGVILAMAALLIYLLGGDEVLERLGRRASIETVEAAGAGAYVLIGLSMLAAGGAFLENLLPLGQSGRLNSGGMIVLLNVATGVEVSAAFALLFVEFLEESRKPPREPS
ncbi:MAG TPA: MnhB domain-containing protein [Nitrospiraceae bacterium]|nr:MnhB domain-containing protein [Nitrospiraceae bacterium]